MNKGNRVSRRYVPPFEMERVKNTIAAACSYYELSEAELKASDDRTVTKIRYICFWIIAKNGELSPKCIGEFFDKTRNTVEFGISKIDAQKDIYRQIMGELRELVTRINNLPRRYDWKVEMP